MCSEKKEREIVCFLIFKDLNQLNKILVISLKFLQLITFYMYSIELMSNRDVLNDCIQIFIKEDRKQLVYVSQNQYGTKNRIIMVVIEFLLFGRHCAKRFILNIFPRLHNSPSREDSISQHCAGEGRVSRGVTKRKITRINWIGRNTCFIPDS